VRFVIENYRFEIDVRRPRWAKTRKLIVETYEEWLDPDDGFDAENDPHPERNFADAKTLAGILGISARHVRRLAADGVLKQTPDGRYSRLESISAFVEYKVRPLPTDGLRASQADLLGLRYKRELAELIPMTDALAAFDDITGNFVKAVAETGTQAGMGKPRAERTCIAAICGLVSRSMATRFATERQALVKGHHDDD